MLQASMHVRNRASQRGLPPGAIDYVIDHGTTFHRSGVIFYYLRKCDIPEQDLVYEQITRLEGTAVVVSKDKQQIITVWRNRDKGLKHIKRKPKYYRDIKCIAA